MSPKIIISMQFVRFKGLNILAGYLYVKKVLMEPEFVHIEKELAIDAWIKKQGRNIASHQNKMRWVNYIIQVHLLRKDGHTIREATKIVTKHVTEEKMDFFSWETLEKKYKLAESKDAKLLADLASYAQVSRQKK